MGLSSWFQNLRNDGNELCSQFSRHISPAYHHDKCERCVQMRLYSMNKGEITFAYVIFIILFLLAVVIGLSGPPIEYTFSKDVPNLDSVILEKGGPFTFNTSPLTRYNKQVWIYVILHTGNSDDEIYSENMLVSVTGSGLGITEPKSANEIAANTVDEKYKKRSFVVENNIAVRNRTRNIQCKMHTCDPILIAHLSYIKFIRYKFDVKFYNFGNFHRKYNVRQITFVLRGYSPDFVQMEMSFRIMYVVVTVFATLWFGDSLRKYAINDWAYEQKGFMIILIFLLLYNGPTYSMSTIFNHWSIGFLNSVFQTTFVAVLALFNICLYHAFRQNERRFLSFYLEKMTIVFILWFLEVVVIYNERVYEYLDFSFSFKLDSPIYQTVTRWRLLIGIFYVIYLLVSMLKGYTDLRTMPFFDKRLKFASTNVVFFSIIWLTAQKFGYGITDIVEDSYISDTTEWRTNNSSAIFMALYAFLNFYIFLIVYIYSPAQKPIFESVVMKDNPAFSMVNDSEDEDDTSATVFAPLRPLTSHSAKSFIYTSDDEEDQEHKSKGSGASSLLLSHSNILGRDDDSD